jgi:hypothetical protein
VENAAISTNLGKEHPLLFTTSGAVAAVTFQRDGGHSYPQKCIANRRTVALYHSREVSANRFASSRIEYMSITAAIFDERLAVERGK